MTKEALDLYSLGSYARDHFGGNVHQCRASLVQYSAGLSPCPPVPEVDGMHPSNVAFNIAGNYTTLSDIYRLRMTVAIEQIATILAATIQEKD